MKSCFRRLLIVLLVLPSFMAARVPVYSQQESTPATKELSVAANAVISALDKQEVEQAFQYMTKKGADQYVGMILEEAVTLASEMADASWSRSGNSTREEADDAGPPPLSVALTEVLAKYKLDQIEFPGPEELLAKVKPEDRAKVAAELSKSIAKFVVSPMKLKLGEIAKDSDTTKQVIVDVYQFFDKEFIKANPPAPGVMMIIPHQILEEPQLAMQLIFTKAEGAWKFDGIKQKFDLESIQQGEASDNELAIIDNLEVSGKDILDNTINLADYKGKVVLVDFWGTWCGPCVSAFPDMSKLRERLNAKGFEILGVASDDSKTLKSFLEKKPLTWQNIVDSEGSIAERYGIEGFPTTLLIDKEGKHVASNLQGKALEDAIELLLEGKPLPSTTETEKSETSQLDDD